MPRHRIEREPRHRAQRPAQERPRRVQFRAVPDRPPGHRRPGSSAGIPWQAISAGASERLTALTARFRPYREMAQGIRFRPYPRTLLTGAMRGLLVSPWFAAGAGFVVAAGAFMYAPHAHLSFGNPLVTRSHCPATRCQHHSTTEQAAAPVPAGGAAGLITPSPTATATPPPATTGLTFHYSVNWQGHDTFQMVLTVTARKAIGNWRLSFEIPDATNLNVIGADWQKSAANGVTATGTTFGGGNEPAGPTSTPSPRATSGYSWSNTGSGGPDAVYLIVNGDGTPDAPASCTFDGAPCHFSLSR